VTQFLMNNTIQLYIDDNAVNEFRQLIMDSIFNTKYLIVLDQYMVFIKNTKLPKNIKDTLRMTLIQN
jgi:DNA-dependent RNA polymerase auxiliary subunit epsilon